VFCPTPLHIMFPVLLRIALHARLVRVVVRSITPALLVFVPLTSPVMLTILYVLLVNGVHGDLVQVLYLVVSMEPKPVQEFPLQHFVKIRGPSKIDLVALHVIVCWVIGVLGVLANLDVQPLVSTHKPMSEQEASHPLDVVVLTQPVPELNIFKQPPAPVQIVHAVGLLGVAIVQSKEALGLVTEHVP